MECTQDWDCPVTQTCFHQRCHLPCDVKNPCAQNAVCVNTNHTADCSCSNGFEGNGFVGCQPSEFLNKYTILILFIFRSTIYAKYYNTIQMY